MLSDNGQKCTGGDGDLLRARAWKWWRVVANDNTLETGAFLAALYLSLPPPFIHETSPPVYRRS